MKHQVLTLEVRDTKCSINKGNEKIFITNILKTFDEKLLKTKHLQQTVIIAVRDTGLSKTFVPNRPVINSVCKDLILILRRELTNLIWLLLNTCIVLNTFSFNKCATKFSAKRSNPAFNPCKLLLECMAHHCEVDVKDTII